MKAQWILWRKDVEETPGQQVGKWLSPHPKKQSYSASFRSNGLDFNQLKIYSLLQADNLTGSSSACFLFTGKRQAINTGFSAAQGQGMGPSWLFVYKYR